MKYSKTCPKCKYQQKWSTSAESIDNHLVTHLRKVHNCTRAEAGSIVGGTRLNVKREGEEK